MKKMQLMCVIAVIATAGISQAAVTYTYSDVDKHEATGVTAVVTGATMEDMEVRFNGGAVVTWASLGGNEGEADDGFGNIITIDGSPGTDLWSLTGANLDTIYIDAGPGEAVFDVVSDAKKTVGSSWGRAFTATVPDTWTVAYSGPVSLAGQGFEGDLYRYMTITTNGDWSGTINFDADVDHVSNLAAVPAPGALLLAGLGSGVVGFIRRRQWA